MNKCILHRNIDLPENQMDYNKFWLCVRLISILYPSIICTEEGSYFTIHASSLDAIDHFIDVLRKLINCSDIIINITTHEILSVECELNQDLITLLKKCLK